MGNYLEVNVEKDYTSPDFRKLGATTNTVAIVPVRLNILPGANSKTDANHLQELAYREAYNARQMLYSFMIVERNKKQSWIEVQNIVVTDSILAQNNITYENIGQYSAQDLAQLLGVETVIISTVDREEKLAQPNLLADNIITSTFAIFRSGVVKVSAYDGRNNKLTWFYEREITEGLGSETNRIFLTIMQRSAMFFPYFKL